MGTVKGKKATKKREPGGPRRQTRRGRGVEVKKQGPGKKGSVKLPGGSKGGRYPYPNLPTKGGGGEKRLVAPITTTWG